MAERAPGVIVTGAAGGIGRALCAAFDAAGYHVVATDRTDAALPPATRGFIFDLADLTGEDGPARFRGAALEALDGHPLTALVNNAAVQLLAPTGAIGAARLLTSLAVNLVAPCLLVETLLAELSAAGGTVINIGSVHAELSKPGFLPYAVSKAALAGLTRALALDLAAAGIRVNEIRPGATATPMLEAGFADDPAGYARLAACQPQGRLVHPDDVAAVAVFLASPAARAMTATAVAVDGGIAARLHDPV
ncbi:MAG: SDR family NAD(P)-dependent oxidoreductase [Gammaproteobacteria bacterium]